jgi:hypothetical protein
MKCILDFKNVPLASLSIATHDLYLTWVSHDKMIHHWKKKLIFKNSLCVEMPYTCVTLHFVLCCSYFKIK